MALINERTSKGFHRKLFSAQIAATGPRIKLHKRGDNQNQGQVTTHTLFGCWRGQIHKTGQTIDGQQSSEHWTTWHLPISELTRVGVTYINALDRLEDKHGRFWQAESDTIITSKLFETHIDVHCKQVTPP